MNKVALFDFCETIANFQTADAYVDYVREKLDDKRMCWLEKVQNFLRKIKIIQIVEKITRYNYSINKRIKLLQLRNQSYEELQLLAGEYYQEVIKPNFIPIMMEKLLDLQKQGYTVALVSGGYDIYLRYFMEDYGLDDLISTKIGFKNGNCTGKFDGIDCLREGKTILLDNYFDSKPEYCVAFSDSQSDVPFLRWADEAHVVSKENHQKWVENYNFNEIIWTKRD